MILFLLTTRAQKRTYKQSVKSKEEPEGLENARKDNKGNPTLVKGEIKTATWKEFKSLQLTPKLENPH
jgi:hypothetical protein